MQEAAEPSARGVLVAEALELLRLHQAEGRIAPAQLAGRLGAAARVLLEEKIDLDGWYPVAVFSELVELDWELVGGRDPEFARLLGALSADRLFELRTLPQLDYAERVVRVRNRAGLYRQARLITTVTGALYSFLEPEVRLDGRPDSLEVVYRKAAPLAEVLRFTTEGFMNQVNRRRGSTRRWSSERTSPDVVTFRMPLPARLSDGS